MVKLDQPKNGTTAGDVRSIFLLNAPKSSRRWRVWWRFGFRPILRFLRLLPIAEWRRANWGWRIDIWGMDHFGGRKLP